MPVTKLVIFPVVSRLRQYLHFLVLQASFSRFGLVSNYSKWNILGYTGIGAVGNEASHCCQGFEKVDNVDFGSWLVYQCSPVIKM